MATRKRLIDSEDFAKHLERMARTAYPDMRPGLSEAAEFAKDFPTIDAVEVVHGRWIGEKGGYMWRENCSVCGDPVYNKIKSYNYCPNCGAKMDGGKDNGKAD